MVSKMMIIIGLAFLELGFIEACVIEPVFWLMRFGCIKRYAKKLAYAG